MDNMQGRAFQSSVCLIWDQRYWDNQQVLRESVSQLNNLISYRINIDNNVFQNKAVNAQKEKQYIFEAQMSYWQLKNIKIRE